MWLQSDGFMKYGPWLRPAGLKRLSSAPASWVPRVG